MWFNPFRVAYENNMTAFGHLLLQILIQRGQSSSCFLIPMCRKPFRLPAAILFCCSYLLPNSQEQETLKQSVHLSHVSLQWLSMTAIRICKSYMPAFNFFKGCLKPLISLLCLCVFPGIPGAAEHHLQPAPTAGQQGARHRAQRVPFKKKWRVSVWNHSQRSVEVLQVI